MRQAPQADVASVRAPDRAPTEHRPSRPVRAGLWALLPSGHPRLVGSRCKDCDETAFPVRTVRVCGYCQGTRLEDVHLPPAGSVAAFTTATKLALAGLYRGPVPYTYGLVDLDGGPRIETLFSGNTDRLRIGARVELRIESLYETDEEVVQTFRFVINDTDRENRDTT